LHASCVDRNRQLPWAEGQANSGPACGADAATRSLEPDIATTGASVAPAGIGNRLK
jgi:hypothetical protein